MVGTRALFVASEEDPAGSSMLHALHETLSLTELEEGFLTADYAGLQVALRVLDESPLYLDARNLEDNAEVVVFLSKHVSRKGIPSLTVHTSGNLGGEADLGGRPRQLALSSPHELTATLRELEGSVPEGQNVGVSFEATHHGPTDVGTGSFFVEVGSTPEEWADEELAEAAVSAAIEGILNPEEDNPVAVGVGGGHYAPRFGDMALSHGWDFGHIASKYSVEELDDVMLGRCVEQTPEAEAVLVDERGVSSRLLARIEGFCRDNDLTLRTV